MKRRIQEIRETLGEGRSLREIVPAEERPLIGEGMTMDEIAKLFGVSRQRISALLRDPSSAS